MKNNATNVSTEIKLKITRITHLFVASFSVVNGMELTLLRDINVQTAVYTNVNGNNSKNHKMLYYFAAH